MKKRTMAQVWRQARGATSQAEFARQLGVSASYVSLIESGERTSVSVALLKRAAKTTGLPIAHLLVC